MRFWTQHSGCKLFYRMEIRIHLSRPLLLLGLVAGIVLWWTGVISFHLPGQQPANEPVGGQLTSALITDAIRDIDRERVKQAVLEKQEEILRYQLEILEQQAIDDPSPENVKNVGETRAVLLGIIKERTTSEKLLTQSLQQLWDAEGTTYTLTTPTTDTELDWPVRPLLGISAFFQDAGYKKRFGVDHHAVDIPVAQGSPIRAPADGTVLKVSMNGLGYSYITLAHGNEREDLQTVYGHVSSVTVQEGDMVHFGQIIGRTGGQPGTLGAGLLTTGPHLHFAVKVNGVLVDPMKYLPEVNSKSQ
jgi:murein DD-endopeptidase MepM/ murein hydrolase activator NlpD